MLKRISFPKILVLIALVIYAFVFAEYFLRILKPQALIPRYVTGSEIGIRQNIPNSTYSHFTPEIQVEMRINSAGMRDDREFPIEKPEGTCRIVILGDSFFMSYEVSLEDSFGYQLEKHLKKLNKPCEVLNFAVSGFGTAESMIQLEKRALEYSPDYVVLEWHASDPVDDLRAGLYFKNGDELHRGADSYLPAIAVRDKLMTYPVYEWLIQHSHLYSAARFKLSNLAKELLGKFRSLKNSMQETPEVEEAVVEAAPEKAEEEVSLNTLLINRINEVSKTNDASLVLAEIPDFNWDHPITSSLHHLKGDLDSDITVVKTTDALEKLRLEGNKMFFVQGHYHLTPIGYEEVARQVAINIAQLNRTTSTE